MSLFDESPDVPPRSQREKCCNQVVAREGQPLRPWQVVHELAHSRVPFTVSFLAHAVQVLPELADEVVEQATAERWVDAVVPEVEGDPTVLYIGRLARKR